MKILTWIAGTVSWVLIGMAVETARSADNSVPAGSPDTAWSALQQQAILPKPPATWDAQAPTDTEATAFHKHRAELAAAAADQAAVFYNDFPNSTNAIAAKQLQCKMLETASLEIGVDQEKLAAWAKAQAQLLADPHLVEPERLQLRIDIIQRKRFEPHASYEAGQAEREQDLRALIKEYPAADRPREMLLNLAANSTDEQARKIATELLQSPLSDANKQIAEGILRRLDATGKPLDIQFTAVDGRPVDLRQMKGKVILVDFWATWCGPCVGEIPHVRAAYEKLHDRGFEVVGISFDTSSAGGATKFKRFLKENDMPWPQYFDGKDWNNQFGLKFAIRAIPAMWLIDKKGNLRDTSARDDLESKVEKLLAE